MKKGIKVERAHDRCDVATLRITKSRGKLTLSEIEDILRYGNGNAWCGHYVIMLNCSEATLEGAGYFDEEEQAGDVVDLYPIEEGEFCPVCGEFTPPFQFCPNCGTEWKNTENNAEKLLASMREEAIRNMRANVSLGSKMAWYWSHMGSLDMARQMGFISEDRRQELYEEFKQHWPGMEDEHGG